MTQEQGWSEADGHHDDLARYFEDEEGYPHASEVPDLALVSAALSAVMGEEGDDSYMDAVELLADATMLYGQDGGKPVVRRILSSASPDFAVIADGSLASIGGVSTYVVGNQATGDLGAAIRELSAASEEWVTVGSFGEFAEEYTRLGALFELTMTGNGRRAPTDPALIIRLSRMVQLAQRMHALHERMTSSIIGFGDTRYVMICVRKDSGLTADGSWLDTHFPGWRERLDRELWPGTHYVSPGESSTLCDLRAGRMGPDRRTDRFNETSCERCKARYVELFGPDEEDWG